VLGSHFLAQVPLTVSPFVTLPKAPTLPHNYVSIPSTLPPSSITSAPTTTSPDSSQQLSAYVSSSSGFTAHPSGIIAQNQSLLEQLSRAPGEAQTKIQEWENAIRDRELRDKRRKAPGWLDREEKILEPVHVIERKNGDSHGRKSAPTDLMDNNDGVSGHSLDNVAMEREGKDVADLGLQMDRAFGDI